MPATITMKRFRCTSASYTNFYPMQKLRQQNIASKRSRSARAKKNYCISLSGACATPEFLMYMNYFIQKEYGEDYYLHPDRDADLSLKRRSIDKVITDCFEQVVYSINQPTGARNFQAVFWNVAYYDRYYFESLFGEFVFPDGSRPHWESLS